MRDGGSTDRFERRVLLMGATVAGVWAAGRYRRELDRDDPLGALRFASVFAELPAVCGSNRGNGGRLSSLFYRGAGPLWWRAEVHAAECPDCAAADGLAPAELDQGAAVAAIRELLEARFAADGDTGPSG